jgi:hypothetical protein
LDPDTRGSVERFETAGQWGTSDSALIALVFKD